MELLRDDDALGYCAGTRAQRDALWERAGASAACPAYLLPIFELCRLIHFGAREGKRFDVAGFRDCWGDVVLAHEERSAASGCLLRLLDGGDDGSDNLPRDVWSRAELSRERVLIDERGGDDPRDRARDPWPFLVSFRALSDVALAGVIEEEEWERQWGHALSELPEAAPEPPRPIAHAEGQPTEDLVLDTNFFVELLDELPEDGRVTRLPCQTGRAAEQLGSAQRRFRQILSTRGLSGKLIVPVAVLVETVGIVRVKGRNRATYTNADRVMRVMELHGGDWPLWGAFQFQALSLEVLDMYLRIHEEMAGRVPDRHDWPDFTDAFVLAHGLLNGYPVISGEWTDKTDWNAVRRIFPHLRMR